ncbi:MAG: nucleoside monophosphate kinase [Verrucomicrobia bacterium]|nr:nucleoside monophosphate kinase [Verrucomicrobiota bacterium]
MKPHRLVLLGPPASGKGTQGQLMAEAWHLPITSTGEILRRESTLGTPLGLETDRYTSLGQLVPDEVVIASIADWLDANADAGFILDGTPRTLGQATALDALLEKRGTPLTDAVFLDVPPAVIEDRVRLRLMCARCGRTFRLGWQVREKTAACPQCGGTLERRKDDDPTTLAERMSAYAEKTAPLVQFYDARGLLRRIAADQAVEKVFAQIAAALGRAEAEKEAAPRP